MSLSEQVQGVTSLKVPESEKITKYLAIYNDIQLNDVHTRAVDEFIKAVINIPFGTSTIREVFNQLIKAQESKGIDWTIEEEVLLSLISNISSQLMSYEEPDVVARLRLASIYEANDENMKASIALEQGLNRRCLSDDEKFDWYIRIVRNRLEIDDATGAEGFLKRAALIRHKAKNVSSASIIHFKFSQARVMDSNRNFIDAARKYYEVSTEAGIDTAEQEACLGMALTCVILAPAGPQRNQILRLIHNDNRTQTIPHYDILENLYTNRLLRWEELKTFEESLQPHQKVSLPDGISVLARSVIDHNLLAVSRIYSNINLDQLAKLLGLDISKVEDYAGKMILQGRLAATIDQVDEVVEFKSQDDKSRMLQWEDNVKMLCADLDTLVSDIAHREDVSTH